MSGIRVTFSFQRFKPDVVVGERITQDFSFVFDHNEDEETIQELHDKFEVFLNALGYVTTHVEEDQELPDNVVPIN